MKLADGDKNGLAELDSRAFLGSDIPAGTMMNFRPLGEVACDDNDEAFPCFGVFGFGSAFVELKLSSLGPYFGKV